ncbi:MAG: VCBS repeat-containing protein [Planctomycetaceae bacterium]|nr:VCBS repeat-containing protein [Planctomycetaceae bacterium]
MARPEVGPLGTVMSESHSEPSKEQHTSRWKGLRLRVLITSFIIVAAGAFLLSKRTVDPRETVARATKLKQAGRFKEAISVLDTLSDDQVPAAGLLVKAEILYHDLLHLSRAERAYRKLLEKQPDHVSGNEDIARLLATTGRRSDAVPHVLRLLRASRETDLLMLLARRGGGIADKQTLEDAASADPNDPLPRLGMAWMASAEGDFETAIPLLREVIERSPNLAAAWSLLGSQLAQFGEMVQLSNWARKLPESAKGYSVTWLALAQLAETTGQRPAALRCFYEALVREPESIQATFGLVRLLTAEEDQQAKEFLQKRLEDLQELETIQNQTLFSGRQAGVEDLIRLVRQLEKVGRLWEAYAWIRLGMEIDSTNREIRQLWTRLSQAADEFDLQQTTLASSPASHVDFSHLPIPNLDTVSEHAESLASRDEGISFRIRGSDIGFDFLFQDGTDWPPVKMFQLTGGGLGVIDIENDGYPDLFCTQGGLSPFPGGPAHSSDRLFSNQGGRSFRDVSHQAGFSDSQFGQGIAVGDLNNDGFPDLRVANIGKNALWLNNGDGTFTQETHAIPGDTDSWSTSCLIADLNGDGNLDLYDANYLAGEDVFERTCRREDGSVGMCMPFDFSGAVDQFWLNDGAGNFFDASEKLGITPNGKGLGIAAWRTGNDRHFSLFVANDTTANFYFRSFGEGENWHLSEQGVVSGLAYNSLGKAEGSMGIAIGDVTGDGQFELHVTNFLAESNTLYAASIPGSFKDVSSAKGLPLSTFDVLGFGTQFLDADNDSVPELFVANGHIQDLERWGRPFRMPPQLFRYRGGRFHQLETPRLGEFFQSKWLGRSVAKWDWNADLREDLVVGHLADPSVILENETSPVGNGLEIRCIGTHSSRDAVGTIVRAEIQGRHLFFQLTAGDGYQASNQRHLLIGCGRHDTVDRLRIEWPSGLTQEFHNIAVPNRIIVVEDQKSVSPMADGLSGSSRRQSLTGE